MSEIYGVSPIIEATKFLATIERIKETIDSFKPLPPIRIRPNQFMKFDEVKKPKRPYPKSNRRRKKWRKGWSFTYLVVDRVIHIPPPAMELFNSYPSKPLAILNYLT